MELRGRSLYALVAMAVALVALLGWNVLQQREISALRADLAALQDRATEGPRMARAEGGLPLAIPHTSTAGTRAAKAKARPVRTGGKAPAGGRARAGGPRAQRARGAEAPEPAVP